MKPKITRVSSAPLTGLICCPDCYRLISYDSGQPVVQCHACGATVRREDPLMPFDPSRGAR